MITIEDLAGIKVGDRVAVKLISEQPKFSAIQVRPDSLGKEIVGVYTGFGERGLDQNMMLTVQTEANSIAWLHDWLVESVRKVEDD